MSPHEHQEAQKARIFGMYTNANDVIEKAPVAEIPAAVVAEAPVVAEVPAAQPVAVVVEEAAPAA